MGIVTNLKKVTPMVFMGRDIKSKRLTLLSIFGQRIDLQTGCLYNKDKGVSLSVVDVDAKRWEVQEKFGKISYDNIIELILHLGMEHEGKEREVDRIHVYCKVPTSISREDTFKFDTMGYSEVFKQVFSLTDVDSYDSLIAKLGEMSLVSKGIDKCLCDLEQVNRQNNAIKRQLINRVS